MSTSLYCKQYCLFLTVDRIFASLKEDEQYVEDNSRFLSLLAILWGKTVKYEYILHQLTEHQLMKAAYSAPGTCSLHIANIPAIEIVHMNRFLHSFSS